MKTTTTLLLLFTMAAMPCLAAKPPEELTKKLTEKIRELHPSATFSVTDEGGFVAKQGTTMFTLHPRVKTGEIGKPYQEEGPDQRGFLLRIRMEIYHGPLVKPQTIKGPYYSTFVTVIPAEDEKHFYRIELSYGSKVKLKERQAILDLLPDGGSKP